MVVAAILIGCGEYDDSAIKSDIADLDSRVSALEQQCRNINENVSSLQTLIAAVQNRDGIVSVTDLPGNAGYAVLFMSGKTIYLHNGVKGADGKNGADGYTPEISVRLDSDGVYYWTIDGKWLIVDGKKVRASGTDGKDGADGKDGNNGADGKDGKDGTDGKDGEDGMNGQDGKDGIDGKDGENGADGKDGKDGADGKDGEDGANGQDGKDGTDGKDGADGKDGVDGKDGITPQLKIEEDLWYISYDNGATWSKLGKAAGNDGKDGADGTDGKDGKDGNDGDVFIKSVTIEGGYVIFVLNDEGKTTIKVPMAGATTVSSIKYVPESLEREVKVKYFMASGKPVPQETKIQFEVLPLDAVDNIVKNWRDVLVAMAVYVSSVKAEIGDIVTLDIKNVAKYKDNMIIVTIDVDSLDEVFFSAQTPSGAYLRLSVNINGNESVSSGYLPMVPSLSKDASDGRVELIPVVVENVDFTDR